MIMVIVVFAERERKILRQLYMKELMHFPLWTFIYNLQTMDDQSLLHNFFRVWKRLRGYFLSTSLISKCVQYCMLRSETGTEFVWGEGRELPSVSRKDGCGLLRMLSPQCSYPSIDVELASWHCMWDVCTCSSSFTYIHKMKAYYNNYPEENQEMLFIRINYNKTIGSYY